MSRRGALRFIGSPFIFSPSRLNRSDHYFYGNPAVPGSIHEAAGSQNYGA